MSESPSPPVPPAPASDLGARLDALGRTLGARESEHAAGLKEARAFLETLRREVAAAIERFHAGARAAGAPQLEISLSEIRVDEKHVRAIEFELYRGRHRAIVTAKSRGEITLVGPFRSGKTEGPCRTFPLVRNPELEAALGDFLARFLEEAATP